MDESLNARNAFSPEKGDEQLRQYGFGARRAPSGRTRRRSRSTAACGYAVHVAEHAGRAARRRPPSPTPLQQPRDSFNISGRVDHAINKDHALRGERRLSTRARRATSASAATTCSAARTDRLDEQHDAACRRTGRSAAGCSPSRGCSCAGHRHQQPVGGRGADHPRERRVHRRRRAARGRPAGFRPSSSRPTSTTSAARTRGAPALLFEGGSLPSDDIANYLGTYTFASLADYKAGRPSKFSRRIGDPNLTYSTLQAAVYVQDDWRIARSLLLSAGRPLRRAGPRRATAGTCRRGRRSRGRRCATAASPSAAATATSTTGSPGDLYKQTLPGGRRPPAGHQHRQSVVPDPRRAGRHAADRTGTSGRTPSCCRRAHRMNAGVERALTKNGRAQRDVLARLGPRPAARPQPERPGRRRPPESRTGERWWSCSRRRVDVAGHQRDVTASSGWTGSERSSTVNYTWRQRETNTTGGVRDSRQRRQPRDGVGPRPRRHPAPHRRVVQHAPCART